MCASSRSYVDSTSLSPHNPIHFTSLLATLPSRLLPSLYPVYFALSCRYLVPTKTLDPSSIHPSLKPYFPTWSFFPTSQMTPPHTLPSSPPLPSAPSRRNPAASLPPFSSRTALPSPHALDTIKALTRRLDTMEARNQKQREATDLQLTTICSLLQTATHAVSQLSNRLVISQRAILAQSTEIGLLRNLSDIRANKITLKTHLLVGMELEKAVEARAMLAEFQKEEAALLNKISQANRNFLTIIGGHVDQFHPVSSLSPVHPSTPTVPPGLFNVGRTDGLVAPVDARSLSQKSDDRGVFFSKRRCVSNDDNQERK